MWDRKKYKGSELSGKVVGIVGLGNIGKEVSVLIAAHLRLGDLLPVVVACPRLIPGMPHSLFVLQVAKYCTHFGVHVIGFDPIMTQGSAERLGIELVSACVPVVCVRVARPDKPALPLFVPV